MGFGDVKLKKNELKSTKTIYACLKLQFWHNKIHQNHENWQIILSMKFINLKMFF